MPAGCPNTAVMQTKCVPVLFPKTMIKHLGFWGNSLNIHFIHAYAHIHTCMHTSTHTHTHTHTHHTQNPSPLWSHNSHPQSSPESGPASVAMETDSAAAVAGRCPEVCQQAATQRCCRTPICLDVRNELTCWTSRCWTLCDSLQTG